MLVHQRVLIMENKSHVWNHKPDDKCHACLPVILSPSLASPMGHERTLNPTVSKASICLIVTWQRYSDFWWHVATVLWNSKVRNMFKNTPTVTCCNILKVERWQQLSCFFRKEAKHTLLQPCHRSRQKGRSNPPTWGSRSQFHWAVLDSALVSNIGTKTTPPEKQKRAPKKKTSERM